MNNTLLNQRTINIAVVVSAMLCTALIANASAKPDSLLLSAGFKEKAATTAKQRQELKTLPQGKVSLVIQKEKTFYIYPDAVHDEIYVGDKAQYQAYQNLAAQQSKGAGSIRRKDEVRGFEVPVREFYGFGPLDEMR